MATLKIYVGDELVQDLNWDDVTGPSFSTKLVNLEPGNTNGLRRVSFTVKLTNGTVLNFFTSDEHARQSNQLVLGSKARNIDAELRFEEKGNAKEGEPTLTVYSGSVVRIPIAEISGLSVDQHESGVIDSYGVQVYRDENRSHTDFLFRDRRKAEDILKMVSSASNNKTSLVLIIDDFRNQHL